MFKLILGRRDALILALIDEVKERSFLLKKVPMKHTQPHRHKRRDRHDQSQYEEPRSVCCIEIQPNWIRRSESLDFEVHCIPREILGF